MLPIEFAAWNHLPKFTSTHLWRPDPLVTHVRSSWDIETRYANIPVGLHVGIVYFYLVQVSILRLYKCHKWIVVVTSGLRKFRMKKMRSWLYNWKPLQGSFWALIITSTYLSCNRCIPPSHPTDTELIPNRASDVRRSMHCFRTVSYYRSKGSVTMADVRTAFRSYDLWTRPRANVWVVTVRLNVTPRVRCSVHRLTPVSGEWWRLGGFLTRGSTSASSPLFSSPKLSRVKG
jgi:hypothetical protein